MRFEFATASRIAFGPGALKEAAPAIAALGRRALVVTGRNTDRAWPLLDDLAELGVACEAFAVAGEPTVDMVREAGALARAARAEVVAGFGGGSAIDAAKAAAALLANEGDPLDYLEVVGRGRKLENPAAPCVAIPTTAGTGAEVTRNAVIACPRERVKVSLRSAHMLPRAAIVDPELTHSLPAEVTARTGLDALSQLVEAFVSRQANPMTDGLCREGLGRAARSLGRAVEHGKDAAAREDMALAALLSGLALANAKLGAVHGVAGPFGGMYPDAPHGAVCGRLLVPVLRANMRALGARGEEGAPALARFAELARLLTGRDSARPADAVAWVEELAAALAMPPLSRWGLTEEELPALVERAMRASSMKGNPAELSEEELRALLVEAM